MSTVSSGTARSVSRTTLIRVFVCVATAGRFRVATALPLEGFTMRARRPARKATPVATNHRWRRHVVTVTALVLVVPVGAPLLPAAASPAFSVPSGNGEGSTVSPRVDPSLAAAPHGPQCERTVFDSAVRVGAARAQTPERFARAQETARGGPDLDEVAEDRTAWFDQCGEVFYVEPRSSPSAPEALEAEPVKASTGPVAAYEDTFELASLPGSDHTIYLDFNGGVVSGTRSNEIYGVDPIPVAPFDQDGAVDTDFSITELTRIQEAWSVVTADFAAFDVNVTTAWPGRAAITRTSRRDRTYGVQVMITQGGPVQDACACGGIAVVGSFAPSSSDLSDPAWAFPAEGATGKSVGGTASHEVGHTFGLLHDGTEESEYYSGSTPWAPIMGNHHSQPLGQWSRGEYEGAFEDDIGLIARVAPFIDDDHADTLTGATPVSSRQPVAGRVETRRDIDTFTFTGAGTTTVAVELPAYSNLDTELVVRNSAKAIVARVNPGVPIGAFRGGRPRGLVGRNSSSGGGRVVLHRGRRSEHRAGSSLQRLLLAGHLHRCGEHRWGHRRPGAGQCHRPRPGDAGTFLQRGDPADRHRGADPYTDRATGLPRGLTMDTHSGELRGIADEVGTLTVHATVTDAAQITGAATFEVLSEHPTVQAPDSRVYAQAGVELAAQLRATDGDDLRYTWALDESTPPPAWVAPPPGGCSPAPRLSRAAACSQRGWTPQGPPARSGSCSTSRMLTRHRCSSPRARVPGVPDSGYPGGRPVSGPGLWRHRPPHLLRNRSAARRVLDSATGELLRTPTEPREYVTVTVTATDATATAVKKAFHRRVASEDVVAPTSFDRDPR